MVALKQGSVPDVIANKLDHLLILTSGTEQYLITCTNKKYKFLLTTTLTIIETDGQKKNMLFQQIYEDISKNLVPIRPDRHYTRTKGQLAGKYSNTHKRAY